jgi:hypothetical protein
MTGFTYSCQIPIYFHLKPKEWNLVVHGEDILDESDLPKGTECNNGSFKTGKTI